MPMGITLKIKVMSNLSIPSFCNKSRTIMTFWGYFVYSIYFCITQYTHRTNSLAVCTRKREKERVWENVYVCIRRSSRLHK